MTRHKSRVARRSRHRARRGTRKQSGGSWFASLFGLKPADGAEAAPAAEAAEAAPAVKEPGFLSILFGTKPNPTTPPTVSQNPGPPQLGGRKTRHRRRRSPRRHRK